MAFCSGFPLPMQSPFERAPPGTWVGLASAGLPKKGVCLVSAEETSEYPSPCQEPPARLSLLISKVYNSF